MFEVHNDDFILQVDANHMTIAMSAKLSLAGVATSDFYGYRYGSIAIPSNLRNVPIFIAITASRIPNPSNCWRSNSTTITFLAPNTAWLSSANIYIFTPQELSPVSLSSLGLLLYDTSGNVVFDALQKVMRVVPNGSDTSRSYAFLHRGLYRSTANIKGNDEGGMLPVSKDFTGVYAINNNGTVGRGDAGYISPTYEETIWGDQYFDQLAPDPLLIDVTNY